jgi:hypothetical protein
MPKVMHYLLFIAIFVYSQDKKTFFDQYIIDKKLDALNAILYTEKPTFEVLLDKELKNLFGLKPVSDSLKKEGHHRFDEDISREAQKNNFFGQERMLSLRKRYPISMTTIDNKKDISRLRTAFKIAGVTQMITGATGVLFNILDVTKKESFTIGKEKITIKNKWNKMHTVTTVLSGSIIFSGILMVSF